MTRRRAAGNPNPNPIILTLTLTLTLTLARYIGFPSGTSKRLAARTANEYQLGALLGTYLPLTLSLPLPLTLTLTHTLTLTPS